MSLKGAVRRLAWKLGYDVSRFSPASHPLARRKQLLSVYAVDTVLDVGANTGEFGLELRSHFGFSGKIVSFEPLSSAFSQLQQRARMDGNWQALQMALGDTHETRSINIAGNSQSSSLLGMLPAHLKSAPQSRYVGTEQIEVRPLDDIFDSVCSDSKNICLKIDTQGFESQVLLGAERSLARIDTIQLELSLVPLYESGVLMHEMCSRLATRGYSLVNLEEVFSDPDSGQLLQVDGLFHRL